MEKLLYLLARGVIALLQSLPLPTVARLGRVGGTLAYVLDGRHRHVAVRNLTMCFSEKSAEGINALARENFRRLGENYCCAVKTAAMTPEALQARLEFVDAGKTLAQLNGQGPYSCIVAIGHFGNFELYAHMGKYFPGCQFATTYRALRQPSLDRLLTSLRERSGCLFFERRMDGAALRAAVGKNNLVLGLLSDQSAGKRGARLPFLGHECSTSTAPAIFALRYRLPLHAGICFRIGLARWRLEFGQEIPTRENGQARSVEAIMADVNRAFENAVRRDPANWFWVHNRWKTEKPSVTSTMTETTGETELLSK
jgi:KDO2-lipid IV(A) lauroyltransferase